MASGSGYVIHYVTNHGTQPSSDIIDSFHVLRESELPTLYEDGYKFLGWYLSNDYNPSTKLEVGQTLQDHGYTSEGAIITFYAYWIENESFLIQGTSLTSIADKIRVLSGSSSTMNPASMAQNVDTANNEISAQVNLISQITSALADKTIPTLDPIVDALVEKGQDVPADADVGTLAALIAAIGAGGSICIGTFTPSTTQTSMTITHDLGVVPNIVAVALVLDDGSYTYGDTNYEMIMGLGINNTQSGIVWGQGSYKMYMYTHYVSMADSAKHKGFAYLATDKTITLSNTSNYYKYIAGKTYMWIVAADD